MEHRRKAHKVYLFAFEAQTACHQARDVGHAQRVIESRMQRAWINQAGKRELLNAAQPLQGARFQQLYLGITQGDEVVDGVAYPGGIHTLLLPKTAYPNKYRTIVKPLRLFLSAAS
jgi:hypothetical protein